MQEFVFCTKLTHPLEEDNDPADPDIIQDLTTSLHQGEALVFSTKLTHSIEEENNEDHDTLQNETNSEHGSGVNNFDNSFMNDRLPSTSSPNLQTSTEILVYCQNVNRMRSAGKMNEINKNILSSTYSVIMVSETSWDDSVRSEEVFGNNYNVYRDDRNFQWSGKKIGRWSINSDFDPIEFRNHYGY